MPPLVRSPNLGLNHWAFLSGLGPRSNATFNACETGTPNALEAEAALYEAAYSKFPSCASADYEVTQTAGVAWRSVKVLSG